MRLSKTIERNLVLVEQLRTVMNARPAAVAANENETNKIKSAKPQDIIRLYDIILIVTKRPFVRLYLLLFHFHLCVF